MNNKRTIFILGAGASKPYGFPLGNELKAEIINLTKNKTIEVGNLFNNLFPPPIFSDDNSVDFETLSKNENPLLGFADAFNKSGKFTIDEFLRTRKNFREIGKFAIAYLLLKSEKPENYFRDEWFQVIWNEINKNITEPNQLQRSNIGFVTFNYDISLEHILFEAIRNTFGEIQEEDIRRVFEALPIVHVHGKIKKLPWEEGYQKDLETFGLADMRAEEIFNMSQGIKLVHENDENQALVKAKRLISEAENIAFLGFGFHKENIDKLTETKFEWVQQNRSAISNSVRKINSRRNGFIYSNPVRPNNPGFRESVMAPQGQTIEVPNFSRKKLISTGIKMADGAKREAKGLAGLAGLNFSSQNTIIEFLRDNLTLVK